jgi:LytS/YehU family sensor histidine kinase
LISAKQHGERCTLVVQDNGAGYAERQNATGVGLQNIRGRLENVYGNQARFSITGQAEKGPRVEILLPCNFDIR